MKWWKVAFLRHGAVSTVVEFKVLHKLTLHKRILPPYCTLLRFVNFSLKILLVPISLFGYLPVFSYCEMANGGTCLLPLAFALDFL